VTDYIPPWDPGYAHIQKAQQEEIRRIEEMQKAWAHQQELEAKRRQAELERQIAAEILSRANQTGQGR